MVAVVLANLPPKQAARVMGLLPTDERAQLIAEMASLGDVSPGAFEELDAGLRRHLERLGASLRGGRTGARAARDILELMDDVERERVLVALGDGAGRMIAEHGDPEEAD